MKTRIIALAVAGTLLTSGAAMAGNFSRAASQTGYFAAGAPAIYNPFSGSHSAHWWRVFLIAAITRVQGAIPGGGGGGGGTGGGGGGGGAGAPGPVAGAGLPFLAVAGAIYLVRRRRATAV